MQTENHCEGNPEQVFADIFSNKQNPGSSRPVLMILGGVLRGVYGGGIGVALLEKNVLAGFDTIVGISTGAISGAYFITEQPSLGTSIYYEECMTKSFLNLWKFFKKGYIMDIEYLGDLWRGKISGLTKSKKLDLEKLKNSSIKLLVGVTSYEKGEGELLDVKKFSDPICPIVASCSVPLLTQDKILCEGKNYTDGALSFSFPAKEVIEKIKPTSILVIPNRSSKYRDNFWVLFWESVIYYFSSIGTSNNKKFLFDKQKTFDNELKFLQSSGVPYAILWSDTQVSAFTFDKTKLQNAVERSRKFMLELLQKYWPN